LHRRIETVVLLAFDNDEGWEKIAAVIKAVAPAGQLGKEALIFMFRFLPVLLSFSQS